MPLDAWLALLPVSLAIAALTVAEGVVLSQSEGRKHGEEIAPNEEVFAYGLSNLAAALFAGMPMGASASRTAAIAATGARTQVPAVGRRGSPGSSRCSSPGSSRPSPWRRWAASWRTRW
jgi:MFS superfamily sulfate permease-like transporter